MLERTHYRFFHWLGGMLSRRFIPTALAIADGIIDDLIAEHAQDNANVFRQLIRSRMDPDLTPTEVITRTRRKTTSQDLN